MSNLSYCQFENTFNDLEQCFESLEEHGMDYLEENAGQYEKQYIRRLVELCAEIADNHLKN